MTARVPVRRTVARFQRRVRARDILDDVFVTLGVSGGPPRKRLDRYLTIDLRGKVKAGLLDEHRGGQRSERVVALPRPVAEQVLLDLADVASDLAPRPRRTLRPDSLVGRVLIETPEGNAMLRFDVTEQNGELRQRELESPKLDRLMEQLTSLTEAATSGPR